MPMQRPSTSSGGASAELRRDLQAPIRAVSGGSKMRSREIGVLAASPGVPLT